AYTERAFLQPARLFKHPLTQRICLEAARVRWLRQEVRSHTERIYQKRGQRLLTEAELMQFIQHLTSLPDYAYSLDTLDNVSNSPDNTNC
ncbi:MAG: hypothetical protein PUQ00_29555, partial [Nostoc sp. S13]|nr:hypothetical protein [Nostoc sp. S13]